MNPRDYIRKAVALDLPNQDYAPITTRLSSNTNLMRLLHAAVGMSGETGEVADIIKKVTMYNKPLNREVLLEECGDVLWYMAIMLDELDSSFPDVMQRNITKLHKRYPQGFNESDAVARKDKV